MPRAGRSGIKLTKASDDPVTVALGASISTAGKYAIFGAGTTAWTIANDGSLTGATFAGVTIDSGTVINGGTHDMTVPGVVSGGGTNTLELAAGTAAGTLRDLGTGFTNFDTVVVDAGAAWQLAGINTLAPGAGVNWRPARA